MNEPPEGVDDFEERLRAIEEEPDETIRRRMTEQLLLEVQQKKAQATVELVEQVRTRLGDKAADETLRGLRRVSRKGR